jgi:hypothetical protein
MCCRCGFVASTDNLKRHQQTHGALELPCKQSGCAQSFGHKDELRRHLRSHPIDFVGVARGDHDGADLPAPCKGEPLAHPASKVVWMNGLGVVAKVGILLTSSACLHIVSNYGHAEKLSMSTNDTPHCGWVCGKPIGMQVRLHCSAK